MNLNIKNLSQQAGFAPNKSSLPFIYKREILRLSISDEFRNISWYLPMYTLPDTFIKIDTAA